MKIIAMQCNKKGIRSFMQNVLFLSFKFGVKHDPGLFLFQLRNNKERHSYTTDVLL